MNRVLTVFFITAIMMLLIFRFAGWYADNAALPRYCEDPQATVGHVGEILSSDTPAENKKRRPYIVAAKLIFLVPQQEAESLEQYLLRLRVEISEKCGTSF